MKKPIGYIIGWALFVLFITWTGCSTTRRIPEGEVLYTGVKKIKIIPREGEKLPAEVKTAVKSPLSVAPNNPLYSPYIRTPFPLGLWVYNYLQPKKEKGFKHWIYEKLVKEPVLISDVQPDLRVKVVDDILANYGYFGASSKYELLYSKRNKKKARVNYTIDVPRPFTYESIVYPLPDTDLTKLIDSTKTNSLLRVGAQYNADTLEAERARITTLARNSGYYYFRPEYIEYLADTTQHPQKVNLRMVLRKGIPPLALKAYRVGEINIALESASGKGVLDTMYLPKAMVTYLKPMKLRKSVLSRSITLNPGKIYSVSEQNVTQSNLGKLGIFRYVNLSVTPIDSLRGSDSLNVYIDATFDIPLEAEFEFDVSSKSNSFIGPGVIFGINQKNMFGGGEVLAVKLNGSYEWQTGKRQPGAKTSLLNSYEFGLNSSLAFPRLLAPRFIPRSRKYGARTTFQLGADLMNRPHYFRMLSLNMSANYDFQSSAVSYHSLTPVKLIYNNLLNTSASFEETLAQNPAIALSFRNQFIPSTSYSYTFDKTYGVKRKDRLFWQTTGTSAGNILAGAMDLFGVKGEKKIWGRQFSQFVKGTTEVKYYYRLWGDNWIVSRFMLGAGYAYGNSTVMPYSEQFYIGGANSIRAFTIRSLGPGSYRPAVNNPNGYFDQTGDFKMEANVEFRFKILGGLHGAVFLDAGNIWLLKKDPQRPGGELDWKRFGREIALGTGVGLRYDISYLVIRADLGIGLHTPYPNPAKPGYYNIKSFKDGLGFHLAIGYPF